MNPKVLLITDRSDLVMLQVQRLRQSGIEVSILNDIVAKNMVSTTFLVNHDLLLLYLLEEKSNSLELCQQLHDGCDVPILVFTLKRDDHFWLRLYEAGAADCIIQPLRFDLLMAKIQAWLRYTGGRDKTFGVIRAYGFRFDPTMGNVITPQDRLVHLSPLEAKLLHALMANNGRVVLSEHLVHSVWPSGTIIDNGNERLQTIVHRLRRKLGSQYIHHTRNRGYSFRPQKLPEPDDP